MASIAMMIGGAVLNAAAFTGGNDLAKFLAGDNGKAALEQSTGGLSVSNGKILTRANTAARLDQHQRRIKEHAQKNFTNTDYAFKLYNQSHPDQRLTLPKVPNFSDMYQPSDLQKQGELLFVGGGALALGYAAFRFL